ncbi:MAG: macro domain-containing protein [Actinomycetota bacterium]|nr:macro domain-containing protein [Actinomycetota bacterium]
MVTVRYNVTSDRSVSIRRGDITRVEADAIVNAANSHMAPGGGVSGAIHSAAGPELAEECLAVVSACGPLQTGQAAITGAGALWWAKHVVHALGPVWHGGGRGEPEALASAYRSAIRCADEAEATTIAFPSISTGIFGYPVKEAAPVALHAIASALRQTHSVQVAKMVLFDETTYNAYERALKQLAAEESAEDALSE